MDNALALAATPAFGSLHGTWPVQAAIVVTFAAGILAGWMASGTAWWIIYGRFPRRRR